MGSTSRHTHSGLKRGDALRLWYDVMLDTVRSERPDLTARQMSLMLTVYIQPGPHTVRSLAAHLDVTKAVISRALDTLGGYGFISRAPDPSDKRSILIKRTARGSTHLIRFAETIRGVSRSIEQAA
ncbi:MarR family transcriptional regulator [Robiginitomaculum antarcticum]|uniref:MarR family transcriptional regulator n=1 Tax=Robiginitomaculum antarcticum TaxID=437507 RepID=UPI0003629499|nr:MarR family transcriptional regulator [Robiginitomaculum antarcticum]